MKLSKLYWWFRLQCLKPFLGKVGRSSYLGPSISLEGMSSINLGKRVRIYPGNRIEAYNGGKIIIGDNCSIGQNFHVISSKNSLEIGKNTTISGNVFITNVNHDYRQIDVHVMEQNLVEKPTLIGENCFLGFGVSIQAGTVLGKQCIVGSNAVVSGKFPDYSVIVGNPAKIIKQFNRESGQWDRIK